MSKPRPLSIVKFDKNNCTKSDWEFYYKATFENTHFVMLGEIPNQPDHCMLIELTGGTIKQGPIIGPYDINDFIEDN